MTEDELLQAVRDLARFRGWYCYHTYRSTKSEPGFPDLVLSHPKTGQLIFAELKSDRGLPSKAQLAWLGSLPGPGRQVFLWRPRDLARGDITRALTPVHPPAVTR